MRYSIKNILTSVLGLSDWGSKIFGKILNRSSEHDKNLRKKNNFDTQMQFRKRSIARKAKIYGLRNPKLRLLALLSLFFICSFLHGAETVEEGHFLAKYRFYEKEDFIKIHIVLPVETMSESTLCRINSPDSRGVAVKIKNDQLKYLENFYQLVDIEVYATPSPEEGGVTFEIKENLEKLPANREVLKDQLTKSAKFFVKTDKQVDFKKDVLPNLTYFRDNSKHVKYVRFFTNPS